MVPHDICVQFSNYNMSFLIFIELSKNVLQLPYYAIFYYCWEVFDIKRSL